MENTKTPWFNPKTDWPYVLALIAGTGYAIAKVLEFKTWF